MKKYVIVLTLVVVAAAAFVLTPAIADALCGQYGVVTRVSAQPGSSTNWIYMKNGGLSTYYYYTTTNDTKLVDVAVTALTSQSRVYVRGNRASCVTTGTSRAMGTTQYIAISP